jgi:hypothetical protein
MLAKGKGVGMPHILLDSEGKIIPGWDHIHPLISFTKKATL